MLAVQIAPPTYAPPPYAAAPPPHPVIQTQVTSQVPLNQDSKVELVLQSDTSFGGFRIRDFESQLVYTCSVRPKGLTLKDSEGTALATATYPFFHGSTRRTELVVNDRPLGTITKKWGSAAVVEVEGLKLRSNPLSVSFEIVDAADCPVLTAQKLMLPPPQRCDRYYVAITQPKLGVAALLIICTKLKNLSEIEMPFSIDPPPTR